jgi:hypothetical protein
MGFGKLERLRRRPLRHSLRQSPGSNFLDRDLCVMIIGSYDDDADTDEERFKMEQDCHVSEGLCFSLCLGVSLLLPVIECRCRATAQQRYALLVINESQNIHGTILDSTIQVLLKSQVDGFMSSLKCMHACQVSKVHASCTQV